ncbi:flagellar export chaperone FliS [Clostridium paraputrificum]|uniref:flagellar export chaperone FliS n=1 Tax=Clostridium TaxID=1485 RepID=UPI003D327D43
MYPNGYNVYKNNSVNYASKEQLLLMLVDGAVKFAKRSERALLENNIKASHENLVRTQDIFIELMSSLDKGAGDWAVQLFKVYQFINDKLVEANLKKDVKILNEVMPLIEEVRDLWNEVYDKAKIEGK